MAALVQNNPRVDILVNNAATFPGALTVKQDVESFESTFGTNVRGTYFLVAGLVPGMLDRGHGSIITTDSVFVGPGATVLTRTPLGPNSVAHVVAEWGDRYPEQVHSGDDVCSRSADAGAGGRTGVGATQGPALALTGLRSQP